VQQVLYLLAPQIEAQGVVVDLAGLPPALQVQAEPVALEQIIHNLVLNALQAMEAVPRPARRLRLHGSRGRRGCAADRARQRAGLHRSALPRAFEPFFTTRPAGWAWA
jgi:C4-dicarboxylate-specific signal transduction histidine kinase